LADRSIAAYSLVIGVLYLIFGVLEIVSGLGSGHIPFIGDFVLVPRDTFGGLMLILISIVFFRGIPGLWHEEPSSLSFVMVGTVIGLIYGVVYLIVLLSNGLGFLLGFEEWIGWIWMEDVRPEIWLGIPVAPLSVWTMRRIREVTTPM
jgi:hypothetical protein